jgi:hypothetical protein
MKPYTVSGNLICPEFRDAQADSPVGTEKWWVCVWDSLKTQTDAYEQLESEQPGELLYMSKPLVEPPCDVER